jgi:hypothetical protein
LISAGRIADSLSLNPKGLLKVAGTASKSPAVAAGSSTLRYWDLTIRSVLATLFLNNLIIMVVQCITPIRQQKGGRAATILYNTE